MAISKDTLIQIIREQQAVHLPDHFIPRIVQKKIEAFQNNSQIIVITGIRRCGKSTVLQSLRQSAVQADYYFNFDDDRLIHFTVSDFQFLYEVFLELYGEQDIFYFDEIQNIPEWERFIRRLQDQGKKIYITGSNATMFSQELGTRLTGRYIAVEMYPISFYEYATYQTSSTHPTKNYTTIEIAQHRKLFRQYFLKGGIPEYIQNPQTEYLHFLYQSIVYRDIMARYNIAREKPLKELVFYLASHIGKLFSYNKAKNLLGLGSATTVNDYCHYLENSFLFFLIHRFDYSLKKQILAPKKVYCVDHVFAQKIGFRFIEDQGRLLENIVFLELKRRYADIYYHEGRKECDFLIKEGTFITQAIQVTQSLENSETKERECLGLLEALETYSLEKGLILTEYEKEEMDRIYHQKTYHISVLPIWEFLMQAF